MPGRPHRARRFPLAITWLVAALFIALGGAGLAVSADHLPGDASRPELTWVQDVAFQARIRALAPDYTALADDVAGLGDTARHALADLVARRQDLLANDLATGDRLVASIEARVSRLDAALRALGATAEPGSLGDRSRTMLAAASAAVQTTAPVPADWRALADGSLPAVQLTAVLQRHDDLVFAATQRAHAGRYRAALATLAEASGMLDQARRTRDALANRADVSTLSTYIDRMSAYDTALVALYTELQQSGGRLTARGERLVARVAAAQKLLPPDTRALVVILGEIAQAGLNQAAIAIEEARGDLADAVAALHLAH